MPNSKGRRRRFGAVRQLKSGRWQARYRDPATGELQAAPYTFDTKTDADVWLTTTEAEIIRGTFRDPDAGKITVKEWGERWFQAASPHLKRRTVTLYAGLLRLWIYPRMGAYELSAVRPIHVKEWLLSLQKAGLSASRIRTAYRVLSQVFASAVDNELIAVTPCRGIKLPRLPETEPHILSTAEIERLISHLRPPHDLLVKLLAYAGLRIGEAFALRRMDVDLANGMIWVDEALLEDAGQQFFDTPKSHQKRPLALPTYLVKHLRAHLDARVEDEPEALLFLGRTRRPLRYKSWRRTHFDKAVDLAGLKDVTPQDLRATHASQVADRHGVMAAARRLGHANASVTTRHYARSRDGQDAEIAKQLNADHQKAQRARTKKAKAPKRPNGNVARKLHDHSNEDPKSTEQGA
ncbi:tyrosine-type recombinase/integrase [Streptomyces sp. RB6PN25]|uniref:Tyrosine-type recombinase/integrase n=1 Tax=Streptomyces humicola TaxID=2953240 RepID=A0ABT1PUH0_9ACTN|nr:tyrosine-type recombinase/integrase [Streptomyces humicola]MCQ4081317.1 tyrosine-type recombinase/integrase [Streptomyces humicola]